MSIDPTQPTDRITRHTPLYYGSFEAPNGCAMDATLDRGLLTITAYPPEWARPEFVIESEDWAHHYSSAGVATLAEANAYFRRLGVRETVFGDEYGDES